MNTFNKKLLLKTVAIVILQGFVLSNIATFSQYSLFASATNKQIRQGWLRKGWKEVLVSGEGQKQADGIRSNKEIPEYIYMVMPKTYYPLVTTAPSSKNHIPEQFSTTPDSATDEDIVLVYRNNGFITKKMAFSMEAAGEIAAELGLEEDKIIGLWMDINFGNISKYSAALSKAGIDDIYRYAGEKLEYNLDLERPELIKVIYKGWTYSRDEFKQAAEELFEEDIKIRRMVAFQEDYIYRAIDYSQWEEIRKNGYMTVRLRENFEAAIGQQVKYYAKHQDYAGIIVKIPVTGPYFIRAGGQVPKITSIAPHFAVPEILLYEIPEQWVSVKEYLALEVKTKAHSIRYNPPSPILTQSI